MFWRTRILQQTQSSVWNCQTEDRPDRSPTASWCPTAADKTPPPPVLVQSAERSGQSQIVAAPAGLLSMLAPWRCYANPDLAYQYGVNGDCSEAQE